MRYSIITTGSRGDVQPFVALALALRERGHVVTIVTNENFRAFVEGFGLAFLPITGDTEKLINSPEALQLLGGGSVLKFFYHLQKVSARTADQANRDILQACATFDHLISSVLPLPIVYSIAEKYKKKLAIVFLSVPPIPTREFPFQVFGAKGFRLLNRLSYRLVGLAYAMIGKQVNAFRKEIGLPPANVMRAMLRSDLLAITAISELLLPQPKDWPANAHVTGFLFLPPRSSATPGVSEKQSPTQSSRSAHQADRPRPEGLEQWLAAGDTPVYMGFGSIPIPDKHKLLAALEGVLAEKRVVFALGWSIIDHLPQHPNLFAIKQVDHEWLLPQCSAAIIHGGIGTIAAVLRSGRPAIVVSILADQPINGQMIELKTLGIHLPFKKLSARRLLQAIRQAETRPIIENVRSAKARVGAEAGLEKATTLLEQYFQ
jgi:UDP:flavonoid glycosyltransferase YjiC (YdhE family)